MKRRTPYAVLLLAAAVLAGCGTTTPRDGGLVANRTVQFSPSVSLPLEKVVFWGAYVGVAYLILDPLTPNWEIEEAPLSEHHIHLSLKMKRFHAGGAGEARQVFQRRARELVQYGGFEGYQIVEYGEGVESSVLGSRRVASGVVRLTGSGAVQDAGMSAPPARMTSDNATKPLS